MSDTYYMIDRVTAEIEVYYESGSSERVKVSVLRNPSTGPKYITEGGYSRLDHSTVDPNGEYHGINVHFQDGPMALEAVKRIAQASEHFASMVDFGGRLDESDVVHHDLPSEKASHIPLAPESFVPVNADELPDF